MIAASLLGVVTLAGAAGIGAFLSRLSWLPAASWAGAMADD